MLRDISKSAALALIGTGTFFFFLMMMVIPLMGIAVRREDTFTQSAVVAPEHVLRVVGLPTSGVLFVIFFVLALRYFRREERPSGGHAPAALKNAELKN